MAHHHDHSHELHHERKVLWIVLALNFSMFSLEIWQGIFSGSTALIADSMDFFSDSLSYVITLFVIASPLHVRAKASLFKAAIMLLLAVAAVSQGGYNLLHAHTPDYLTMGWVGALALAANVISATLLYRTRGRDSNMQSVWLCSRNDAIGNVAVLAAAALVWTTNTLWPDLIVALIIAWLGASSALKIIAQAKKELRHDH